ncbi:MAG: SurA N-terminal domain-containing protein [Acidobacteriia bacterium]|nr:SurA N-terminal domain-containing protein [Terriglobia bacterium]
MQSVQHRRSALLLGVAGLLMLAGCPGRGTDKNVMAKVNGYKVLRSEVDKSYNSQTAGSTQKPTQAEEEALRLNILLRIMDVQLHLQQAQKLGVVATDDEVESKFTQIKAPYTQEEFQKILKDRGFSEEEYKQEIRRNLTIEKLLNKEIASKITISDGDIQNYYNLHKADFNLIEPRYYVAHIFVSALPPTGGTADDQRKKIQMIYNRLQSGEDFAQTAARYSEDPDTAHNGGELGAMPESQLKNTDAATRDAIPKLTAGQHSPVIPVINPNNHQTTGYRIVKLLSKEAAGQRDLNDPAVQQWIRGQLRIQREQLLKIAYDEVLRDNASIENYYAEQIMKNAAGTK